MHVQVDLVAQSTVCGWDSRERVGADLYESAAESDDGKDKEQDHRIY